MAIDMFFSKPVKDCLAEAKKTKTIDNIRGLIVPHAGYIYSGVVAGAAYKLLKKANYSQVIVLGPSHYQAFNGVKRNFYDEKEHSIALQWPFLDYVLEKKFKKLEILCGQQVNAKIEAEKLNRELDNNTLVVASSDLSHFLPEQLARKVDHQTIEAILQFKTKNLEACGEAGIAILNYLAKMRGWKNQLIDYKTSAELTNDYSRVVGYASFAYYESKK